MQLEIYWFAGPGLCWSPASPAPASGAGPPNPLSRVSPGPFRAPPRLASSVPIWIIDRCYNIACDIALYAILLHYYYRVRYRMLCSIRIIALRYRMRYLEILHHAISYTLLHTISYTISHTISLCRISYAISHEISISILFFRSFWYPHEKWYLTRIY